MFAIDGGLPSLLRAPRLQDQPDRQFLLALLAQTSAQRGAIWWAAKHRRHHRHSDTELDVHSPRQHGVPATRTSAGSSRRGTSVTDYRDIPDFARYPELMWLDRHQLPARRRCSACCTWLIAGWPGLVVGFCWSTVLLWHATFAINSLAHVTARRYVTGDDSRNNWFLAILTMGEGWHNNHHAYQSSARQGFRWWEYDLTYYVLKLLSWLGIVWDLQSPPEAVVRNEQRLGRKVIEKVARQLAVAFPGRADRRPDPRGPGRDAELGELQSRVRVARCQAEAFLAELHLPHVPSVEEIRRYAETAPRADTLPRRDRGPHPTDPAGGDLAARLLTKAEATKPR